MLKQPNSNSLPTKENLPIINFNIEETVKNNITSNLPFKETPIKNRNICPTCNKPFSTLGNMKNHIMTIHKNIRPFICTYKGCNKKYSVESRYQVHLRTHLGKKPFICQICGKSFNEKGNLKTHLRFHSEKRPFKCPHCIKCYKTNGHLKDHIEIQHNMIKKYACQFCNKKFGRISTLKSHIRTHTGEKNFKCKIEGCNKFFAEKGNMEMHYRRHLKKLNKTEEIDENNKKKYGEKTIENENEAKIEEAIDMLKDIKNNVDIGKCNEKSDVKTIKPKRKKKNIFINSKIYMNDINTVSKDNQIKNINYVNNNFVYNSSINNLNVLNQNNEKINNFRIINENNFNTNINNFFINYFNNYTNNYANNDLNYVNNIRNEGQNIFGSQFFLPLIQELHPIEPLVPQENKIDILLNKDMNLLNYDISNDITRPSSKMSLIMNKKSEEIFPKEEELFSEEEDFSKTNNCREINDNNSYHNDNNINMNMNMPLNQNYDLLDNQHIFFNEERLNNFNHNYQQLNEAKNIPKFQEQIKFFE